MADIIHIGKWQLQHKHKNLYIEPGECDHKHLPINEYTEDSECR